MSVWTAATDDICRLQGKDVELAALVNCILGAATAGHLPLSSLRLNLATDTPDGGVDAAVDGSLAREADRSGLLIVPTCWQYKATAADGIKPPKGQNGGQEAALRHEIRKPHVQELIANGYGYRLCLADSLTPDKRRRWEGWLLHEARKVNPDGPPPVVVGADLLAEWCSHYPGIVRRLRPFLGAIYDFRFWDRIETADACSFVSPEARTAPAAAVRAFADFAQPVRSPVLLLSGEAGVGKTRCVLEAVRPLPGIEALLLASDDEATALDAVRHLANEPDRKALFVVDGIRAGGRTQLARLLAPAAGRIRLIAIDNERQDDAAPNEVRLAPLQQQDVEQVLAANFPEVHSEQRWAIAQLAGGFVRLAVDMCRNIHLVPQRGDIAAMTTMLRDDYLAARLTPEQRTAVEVVSLVARVGYCGELAGELRDLCGACGGSGLSAQNVIDTTRAIRRSPGFVAMGPRFLYVTPRVIAQAAFRSAWERWVQPDPAAFFKALPASLDDALLRQLSDAGTPEMRRLLSAAAKSSDALGLHLGRLDAPARLLDLFGENSAGSENTGLLQGYVAGLLDRHPSHGDPVGSLIDRLGATDSLLAFGLLTTGHPSLRPIARVLDLVDSGRVPVHYLRVVWRMTGVRPLAADDFAAVTRRLLAEMRSGDATAARAAIDLISMHVHCSRQAQPPEPAFDEEQIPLVRDVLEIAIPLDLGHESCVWGEVLATLGQSDTTAAIRLAVAALGSENSLRLSDPVERYLEEAAGHHPQAVMDELGAGLLSPASGWRLRLADLGAVVAALPLRITRAWVEQYGLDGARALARFLPVPHLAGGGSAVPELTEFVLTRYGRDEEVLGEFCAGTDNHGSRWGDIAAQYQGDAEVARHFQLHPCEAIREWARRTERSARFYAEWFRRDEEEFEAP